MDIRTKNLRKRDALQRALEHYVKALKEKLEACAKKGENLEYAFIGEELRYVNELLEKVKGELDAETHLV
jgi:vacuolar-type H+-ATPase subunit E/Vma4